MKDEMREIGKQRARAIARGILLLLFCCWLSISCKPQLAVNDSAAEPEDPQPVEAEAESDSEVAGYPLERSIRNGQGKELEGTILGKQGDYIAFQRKVDGKKFLISIYSLSPGDTADMAQMEDGEISQVEQLMTPEQFREQRERASRDVDVDSDGHYSYKEALVAAKESGKPVMMIFVGNYYGGDGDEKSAAASSRMKKESEKMEKTVVRDSRFREFAEDKTEFLYIDLMDEKLLPIEIKRRNNSLAGSWSVFRYPTIILVNQNGYEILRVEGYASTSELIHQIDEKMGW